MDNWLRCGLFDETGWIRRKDALVYNLQWAAEYFGLVNDKVCPNTILERTLISSRRSTDSVTTSGRSLGGPWYARRTMSGGNL